MCDFGRNPQHASLSVSQVRADRARQIMKLNTFRRARRMGVSPDKETEHQNVLCRVAIAELEDELFYRGVEDKLACPYANRGAE